MEKQHSPDVTTKSRQKPKAVQADTSRLIKASGSVSQPLYPLHCVLSRDQLVALEMQGSIKSTANYEFATLGPQIRFLEASPVGLDSTRQSL